MLLCHLGPKSKLFGVGVDQIEVESFASFLSCKASQLPREYLGLSIRANMNLSKNWDPISNKFRQMLSSWKVKNLSYRGRLTLLKSVLGSLGTYYFSIFKAPLKVINSLEDRRINFFWMANWIKRKLHGFLGSKPPLLLKKVVSELVVVS